MLSIKHVEAVINIDRPFIGLFALTQQLQIEIDYC